MPRSQRQLPRGVRHDPKVLGSSPGKRPDRPFSKRRLRREASWNRKAQVSLLERERKLVPAIFSAALATLPTSAGFSLSIPLEHTRSFLDPDKLFSED